MLIWIWKEFSTGRIPAHVTALTYLLKEFDFFKMSQEKAAVKIRTHDLEGIQHRKTFLRMLQPELIF